LPLFLRALADHCERPPIGPVGIVVVSGVAEKSEHRAPQRLKASGADVFMIAATPKFAAQAIRKTHEIGWEPMRFLSNTAVWFSSVMISAGVKAGIGVISTAYVKDPDDPAWADDAGVKGWREFMTKYVPEADQHDTTTSTPITARWCWKPC
jgi:hypothetical protein